MDGLPFPLSGDDLIGKLFHVLEYGVDVRHYVLTFDEDLFPSPVS